MTALDRVGRFKAKPLSWRVKTFPSSKAVAIAIEFQILAQIDADGSWQDWSGYGVTLWGDVWIVKKDGKPNMPKVETLCNLFGWGGDIKEFTRNGPPDVVVQVTSEEENYQGKVSYRVGYIDPEDASPQGGGGADEGQVAQIDAQFGSLLRAAAASVKKPAPPKAMPPKTAAPVVEQPPVAMPADDFSKIPF